MLATICTATNNDSIQKLSLQNRNLLTLPSDINFSRLVQLNIAHNRLTSLPKELPTALNLEDLDASNNRGLHMPSFNKAIKDLNLKKLVLNECNLFYLPLEFGELEQLEYLSLNTNFISSISQDYLLNQKLRHLDLGGNAIRNLPERFSEWSSLQYLDLSANPCLGSTSTYYLLSKLYNLEELVLRNASFFDSEVLVLPKLKRVDVSNGTFEKVEVNLKNAVSLEKFTATNCNSLDFTSLNNLLAAPNLKELEMGGSRFMGFDNVAISPSIQKMVLSGNELLQFKPKDQLTGLLSLEIKFVKISCMLPFMKELSEAPLLKALDLYNCGITVLPHSIGKLENLEKLNLSMNKFDNISALFPLKKLKELDVSGCELNLKQLQKLKEQLPNTMITNSLAQKINLPGVEKSKESFSVDPSSPGRIVTSNGTEIDIPAKSLVYADGKPVTEPVTIRYNSFYSLGEIAASGIHMNFSENGELTPFRSAGMFELTASVGDKQVELRPGKKIGIKFKSLDSTNSYNYYQYDSIKQNWKETGKDSILKFKIAKMEEQNKVKSRRDSASLAPVLAAFNFTVPQLANFYTQQQIDLHWYGLRKGKKLKFRITTPLAKKKIMMDTASKNNYLYEVSALLGNSVTWVVDENSLKEFRTKCFGNNKLVRTAGTPSRRSKRKNTALTTTNSFVEWQKNVEFELIPDREKDNFILRFYNATDTFEFHAYPDFRSRDVGKTQKKTRAMFTNYSAARDERVKVSELRKRRFSALYDLYSSQMEEQRQKMYALSVVDLTALSKENIGASGGIEITRFLSLSGFGYHNCDHPLSVPDPVILAAKFIDENSKSVGTSNASAIFIDRKSNLSIGYSHFSNKIPSNTILTVVVTVKDKIYLGKYSTLGKKGNLGKEEIKLSQVNKDFTFSDFEKYIASIP